MEIWLDHFMRDMMWWLISLHLPGRPAGLSRHTSYRGDAQVGAGADGRQGSDASACEEPSAGWVPSGPSSVGSSSFFNSAFSSYRAILQLFCVLVASVVVLVGAHVQGGQILMRRRPLLPEHRLRVKLNQRESRQMWLCRLD